MTTFDFPIEKLRSYDPDEKEPEDFDEFWKNTLDETRGFPLDAHFVRVEVPYKMVEVYDLSFRGYGGHTIRGWFVLPRDVQGKLPCVVEYIGYGGGRNLPTEWLQVASCGWAHLVMDTRGQGSAWGSGDTPDPEGDAANPQYPGSMTRGLRAPENYYYRRVYTDAVRAVEAARSHPHVDPSRIAVWGGSQGGGITIAAASLDPSIGWAMPDVPFLCHFRRAVEITDTLPYQELVHYFSIHRDKIEESFRTLSYFDGIHLARRARAKAVFSVGLMDMICPPSTVFAAFNRWAGPKEIVEYSFNGHEGGGPFQTRVRLDFLKKAWG